MLDSCVFVLSQIVSVLFCSGMRIWWWDICDIVMIWRMRWDHRCMIWSFLSLSVPTILDTLHDGNRDLSHAIISIYLCMISDALICRLVWVYGIWSRWGATEVSLLLRKGMTIIAKKKTSVGIVGFSKSLLCLSTCYELYAPCPNL